MQKTPDIKPGTPEWEAICQMCGLCCLLKTFDERGHLCLTCVRCGQLDKKTRKCNCYNIDYNKRDDNNIHDSCIARGGSPVNLDTLHNQYVVPGFCPYVKKFVGPNKLERPQIDFEQTISEDELPENANGLDYIIRGTGKYFRYNSCVKKNTGKTR
ncbi:MAG: hypothetical protein J5608_02470 [Alphaproteobacteria bacterium]|nr:hypothetical protein [Alphaproteobacteria bacterium]